MTKHPGANRHFAVLDGWRGISACFVALFHFMGNTHLRSVAFVAGAGFFVDFFFVLSGFVIFANYEERLRKGYSFFKFILLRFGRLYPLHLATLFAFISIEIIQAIIPSLQDFAQTKPFTLVGEQPSDIISNFFLFQALDAEPQKGFNKPSWSVSAEFYTYIVFALGIALFKNHVRTFCVIATTIFLSTLILADYLDHNIMVIVGFMSCLVGFSFGGLCWFIWRRYHNQIENKNMGMLFWSFLEIIVVVGIYLYIDMEKNYITHNLAALVASVMVLIFAFEKGIISYVLKKSFFQLIGVLSYSIYMMHAFIAWKLFPVGAAIIEKEAGIKLFINIDGKDWLGTEKWQGDIITLLYIGLVICVSCISYKIIEAPGRNYFRKLVYSK